MALENILSNNDLSALSGSPQSSSMSLLQKLVITDQLTNQFRTLVTSLCNESKKSEDGKVSYSDPSHVFPQPGCSKDLNSHSKSSYSSDITESKGIFHELTDSVDGKSTTSEVSLVKRETEEPGDEGETPEPKPKKRKLNGLDDEEFIDVGLESSSNNKSKLFKIFALLVY